MKKNFVEIEFEASVDSGELLAFMRDGESLGAWESEGVIHILWPEDRFSAESRRELARALECLGVQLRVCDFRERFIPDQDWNLRWAEKVTPILLGRRVLVRQTWNRAETPHEGIELVIDPKQAFGTGYHATTQLLVEWLEDEVRGGEQVLDIGTGSGILAMVAIRLGAAAALAVDNDPVAIECALENAALNEFGRELELRVATLEGIESKEFDLIVANLDRKTILSLAGRMGSHLKPGGRILITGLQVEDEGDVASAFGQSGGEVVSRRKREEWIALQLRFAGCSL